MRARRKFRWELLSSAPNSSRNRLYYAFGLGGAPRSKRRSFSGRTLPELRRPTERPCGGRTGRDFWDAAFKCPCIAEDSRKTEVLAALRTTRR